MLKSEMIIMKWNPKNKKWYHEGESLEKSEVV